LLVVFISIHLVSTVIHQELIGEIVELIHIIALFFKEDLDLPRAIIFLGCLFFIGFEASVRLSYLLFISVFSVILRFWRLLVGKWTFPLRFKHFIC
jgi:hypothetical protein